MSTSLTYNFQNIDVDTIIRDAYERCGVINSLESGLYYAAGRRSLDFLFSSWINEGLNLFTIQQGIIEIVPGQWKYRLPNQVSKILECKYGSANRILGGTATASEGTASNAFDGNINTACTQVTADGYIGYNYGSGNGKPIEYIGILSAVTRNYRLNVEYSFLTSPGANDWLTVLEIPQQQYYFGKTFWFSLPYTESAVYWRIKEVGGNVLNIAELYFDIPYISLPMSQIGRDVYMYYPNGSQNGTSSTYWVDRISTPTLNVWCIPDNSYQFFIYNYPSYIQDCGQFFNQPQINYRFLDAATAGLAARLAQKFAPDRYADLKASADEIYMKAGREDNEPVDYKINIAENQYL